MYRRLTTLFLILTLCLTSKASDVGNENAHFITVTIENGLANNNIYDICTDCNGCLWLATAVGLGRYDGSTVKTYFKEDMNVRSNFVNYVFNDSRDRIWIGTNKGVAFYDVRKVEFSNLEFLTGLNLESPTAWFFEDSDGTIWISFKKHGIIAVDPDTFRTTHYFFEDSHFRGGYLSRLWFEPENGLYMATHVNDGLYFVDLENETLEPFRPVDAPDTAPLKGKTLKGLIKLDDRNFCMASTDGDVYIVNPYDRTLERLPVEFPVKVRELRRVYRVAENVVALVSSNGVFLYDLTRRCVVTNKSYALVSEDKNVHCLTGNLDNGIVIGFHGRGIAIQQDLGFRFRSIQSDTKKKKVNLKGSDVSGFAEYNDTTLFITTRQKGLYSYNMKEGSLARITNPHLPKHIEGAVIYDSDLWMMSPYGIYRMSPITNGITPYREGSMMNWSLASAPAGRLCIHSEEGLLEYDRDEDVFRPVRLFAKMTVLGIARAADGALLVSTRDKGLLKWDGRSVQVIEDRLPSREYTHEWKEILYEDTLSRVWLSPPGGGVLIASKGGTVSEMNTRSGLYSDFVSNIISDRTGNIFITTDRNLSVILPSGKITSITREDGLLNFGFSRNSAYMMSDGRILVGSRDGVTEISETGTLSPQPKTKRELTRVSAGGEEITIRNDRIVLPFDRNTFEIKITEIDPHHLHSGRPLFCLEGYDDTWVPVAEDGTASFINLKPGRYLFRAYDRNIPPLRIRIRPHPLVSVPAIMTYVLILLVIMFLIIKYVRDNEVRKRKAQTMQMELDLHQEKVDFFTTIAHEIKTPLTLITTPLRHVMNNPDLNDEARYDLEVIDKNATYLTTLIKELLEFSKIEKKMYTITCAPTDIRRIVQNVIANFSEQSPSLSWRIDIPDEPVWCLADTSAMMKILNNLTFNALKYAETFIEVKISESGGAGCTVSIVNDGVVVPPEMREMIFETFMQYKGNNEHAASGEGFGIGLSVARSLANLQGGSLKMGSSMEYNEFILTLPLTEKPAQDVIDDETDEELEMPHDGRSTVLIAEDHSDLREYLRKTLVQRYRVLTAKNGEDALKIIESKTNIDIVITDLKMPVMNGIELCSHIKGNPAYSHIMVVVLSANLTPESKIECMDKGADAIIEKPFSMEYLVSRVDNLMNSRKRLIEMLSHNAETPVEVDEPHAGFSAREVLLLNQLNETILKNFTDPDFGVDELAEALGLSRSSLNRKMRDILQTTANNYIREKRIEKAEELLRTSSLQINEICYKVGFQTPSYFIKCFRKKYGKSPNEYANSSDQRTRQ